jgi:hypothetical protein
MSNNVWSLSVDLSTKTAVFTTGLSDAAKAARGSFQEIKDGAREMSRTTSGSMMEARHGVMMLGEEFGIHLPRGLTMFISSLGPVGAAMEAAFPFLAIILGATLLVEKIMKMSDEVSKSGQAWTAISDEIAKWGENSKKELLDVAIQLDRLNGDKLKELQDTLKKLDLTTLDHLKSEFDGVGKHVDEAFTKMRSNSVLTFLGMGNGVDNVQKMFASAMDKINADLAKGDQKQLAADLKAASDQMWNMAAPTYALVQRLHEAHNELGANRIAADGQYQALLKAHGVLESMTQEMVTQQTIEKQKAAVDTRTITPVHVATDPRIASELRKQIEAYTESKRKMAEADEKSGEIREAMESSVTRYFSEEYKKQEALQAEAGKIEAEHELKMGQLRIAAQHEAAQNSVAYLRMSAQERAQMKIQFADEELKNQIQANAKEQAALDKDGKDYENKLRALQNKQLEMVKAFENEKAQIVEKAEQEKAARVMEAESRMDTAIASTAARSIVEGKNMGQAFAQLGKQMLQSEIEHLMEMKTIDGQVRLDKARTAAAKAWEWAGNPILGAVAAATTFAAVMALETGGIVPGVTRGDTVPAMLTPGEAVLPKRLTEGLTNAANSGRMSNGPEIHVHNHFSPQIHAVDADGVSRMLEKHGEKFNQHAENHIRKMNH